MDSSTLISIVVEETLKALAAGGGSARLELPGGVQARAETLAAAGDGGTRLNAMLREGDATRLDRPVAIIGISNRHIHVSPEHAHILFGPGRGLTVRNELRQSGEFAARETLMLATPRGRCIESIRVLGPMRTDTQVELSRTDCYYLGLDAPVRASGDHRGTPGAILIGPKGAVFLEKGVIVADRHIHAPPQWGERWGFRDQQTIACRIGGGGPKPTILENVRIRISPKYVLEAHLDTDDANAAGVRNEDLLEALT